MWQHKQLPRSQIHILPLMFVFFFSLFCVPFAFLLFLLLLLLFQLKAERTRESKKYYILNKTIVYVSCAIQFDVSAWKSHSLWTQNWIVISFHDRRLICRLLCVFRLQQKKNFFVCLHFYCVIVQRSSFCLLFNILFWDINISEHFDHTILLCRTSVELWNTDRK